MEVLWYLEEMEQAHQAEEVREQTVDMAKEEEGKGEWKVRAPGQVLMVSVFAQYVGQWHHTKGEILATT